MKLTKRQATIFYKLNEILNTSPDYFISNFWQLFQKFKYLTKPQYVICIRLKKINSNILINYNHLKKLGLRKRKLIKFPKEPKLLELRKKFPFIFKKSKWNKKRNKKHVKSNSQEEKLNKNIFVSNIVPIVIDSSSNDENDAQTVNIDGKEVGLLEKSEVVNIEKIVNEKVNDVTELDSLKSPEKSSSKTDLVPSASDLVTEHRESTDSSDVDEQDIVDPIENSADKSKLAPDEVNQQLREQLKLLQMGKRDVSLFSRSTSFSKVNELKKLDEPSTSGFRSSSRLSLNDSLNQQNQIICNKLPVSSIITSTPKNISINNDNNSNSSLNSKKNFIDSLLNKLRSRCSEGTMSSMDLPNKYMEDDTCSPMPSTSKQYLDGIPKNVILNEPSVDSNKISIIENQQRITLSDEENSNLSNSSAGEFLGFTEIDTNNLAQLLPTPIVPKVVQNINPAFLSEELDAFMKENYLENSKIIATVPLKYEHDEALVSPDAEPPKLTCPELPDNIEKPRTVAEKRLLLEKKKDIKLLMIENESMVYRELKRRTRNRSTINQEMIKAIQDNDIPFTRDCWKAVNWLNTENGKFFFQTVKVNENPIKILSGRGNHTERNILNIEKSSGVNKISNNVTCLSTCRPIDNIKINGLESIKLTPLTKNPIAEKPTEKKLNIFSNYETKIKAVPLSRKRLYTDRSSTEIELGPLSVFKMPRIQLEVTPKPKVPLPNFIRPYLKLALPHENISTEWAMYAASAIQEPLKRGRKRKLSKIPQSTFTFDIPYCNNQNNVLVRNRNRNRNSIRGIDKKAGAFLSDAQLTFAKDIDRKDTVQIEVAKVLTDMINSVAIGISEDAFSKKDPDGAYGKMDQLTEKPVFKSDNARKSKIERELKRLNTTIINTCDVPIKGNCMEDFCKLGCVCESLSVSQDRLSHCKKTDCIFDCRCPNKKKNENECDLRDPDIKHIRDKVTAFLAKEEKEFTSTVVISNDRTVIMPNSDHSGKRNKKRPKRFGDYLGDRDCPKSITDESSETEKTLIVPENNINTNIDQTECFDSKKIYERLVHVSVNLERIDQLSNLEPWCMVHCLYKCFCKLNATDGNRFEFSHSNDINQHLISSNTIPNSVSQKRQYTFEKDDSILEPLPKVTRISSIENKDERTCVRAQPVYAVAILNRNRKRMKKLRPKIKKWEADQPQLKVFLNNRIKRCVQFTTDNNNQSKNVENHSKSVNKNNILHNDKTVKHPMLTLDRKRKLLQEENRHIDAEKIVKTIATSKLSMDKLKSDQQKNSKPSCTITQETGPDVAGPSSLSGISKSVLMTILTTSSPPNETENTPKFIPLTSNNLMELPNKNISINRTSPVGGVKQANNVKALNHIVSKAMQSICQIQRTNSKKFMAPQTKLLTYAQWKNLVDAYNEDLIYVWSVQFDTNDIILAITVQNVMPFVRRATCVINIKAVALDKLPTIAQMLKMGIVNDKTEQLAVLLSGISNFWRLIGCIHSDNPYLKTGIQVRPTPSTHPMASTKISSLFNILTKQQKLTKNAKSSVEKTANKTISNISLTQLPQKDMLRISLPIPVIGAHRWFMLSIAADFTHIHVPSWKTFLSYEKIMYALRYAKNSNKTVKISPPNGKPDVYAVQNEIDKLFVGPYSMDDQLDLRLFQCYNGQILLLEDYHRIKKTALPAKRTTGCWLYMKDNYLLADERSVANESDNNSENVPGNDANDDDNDCFIIDDMCSLSNLVQEQNSEKISDISENQSIEKNQINDSTQNVVSDDDCILVESDNGESRDVEATLSEMPKSNGECSVTTTNVDQNDCFIVEDASNDVPNDIQIKSKRRKQFNFKVATEAIIRKTLKNYDQGSVVAVTNNGKNISQINSSDANDSLNNFNDHAENVDISRLQKVVHSNVISITEKEKQNSLNGEGNQTTPNPSIIVNQTASNPTITNNQTTPYSATILTSNDNVKSSKSSMPPLIPIATRSAIQITEISKSQTETIRVKSFETLSGVKQNLVTDQIVCKGSTELLNNQSANTSNINSVSINLVSNVKSTTNDVVQKQHIQTLSKLDTVNAKNSSSIKTINLTSTLDNQILPFRASVAIPGRSLLTKTVQKEASKNSKLASFFIKEVGNKSQSNTASVPAKILVPVTTSVNSSITISQIVTSSVLTKILPTTSISTSTSTKSVSSSFSIKPISSSVATVPVPSSVTIKSVPTISITPSVSTKSIPSTCTIKSVPTSLFSSLATIKPVVISSPVSMKSASTSCLKSSIPSLTPSVTIKSITSSQSQSQATIKPTTTIKKVVSRRSSVTSVSNAEQETFPSTSQNNKLPKIVTINRSLLKPKITIPNNDVAQQNKQKVLDGSTKQIGKITYSQQKGSINLPNGKRTSNLTVTRSGISTHKDTLTAGSFTDDRITGKNSHSIDTIVETAESVLIKRPSKVTFRRHSVVVPMQTSVAYLQRNLSDQKKVLRTNDYGNKTHLIRSTANESHINETIDLTLTDDPVIENKSLTENSHRSVGYLICDLRFLGKVAAEMSPDGIWVWTFKGKVKLNDIDCVNSHITSILRRVFFRIIPNNLMITWKFTDDASVHKDYLLNRIYQIQRSEILTRYAIIDLMTDDYDHQILPKRLKDYILVWKLAYFYMDPVEVRNKTAVQVLEKANKIVKSLINKESKLGNIKTFYNLKIQLKTLKIADIEKKITSLQKAITKRDKRNIAGPSSTVEKKN